MRAAALGEENFYTGDCGGEGEPAMGEVWCASGVVPSDKDGWFLE